MEVNGQVKPRDASPSRKEEGAKWALEPVWTLCSRDKCLAPSWDRTPVLQPIAIPAELSRHIISGEKNIKRRTL
jgi:hypothetical protein